MGFCLPTFAAEAMKKSLKSGEIDPGKLSDMTSEERRTYFENIVGKENAASVNALFESKLLLKNQQQGMITWAKQITGIKPEAKRDMLSRVEKMNDILQPKELDMFLEDLAAKRLGITVTAEEAGRIAELAKRIKDTRGSADRMEYGRARVEFNNYIDHLREVAESKTLREQMKSPGEAIVKMGGQAKSIKASLDNSAVFRQGWKAMFTNPTLWAKNTRATFSYIARTFKGEQVMNEIKAEIISRPNYDLMRKAKLAIGTVEEAFPSSFPEKIPYFGRAYKASETAYTGFLYKLRADLFDKYLHIAKQAGVDVTDKEQLESIGKVINSLTGRADLGKLEPAAEVVNNIFFSPRFIKSHIDVLTAHTFDRNLSPFARKQAAQNLAKIVAGTTVILAITNALFPRSVELDLRSSDSGKIRIGNTRFDISGGMASILTLAARFLTMSSKSTVTKEVTGLNDNKYGAKTFMDVFYDFLEGKASPLASVFLAYARGHDKNGDKPTLVNQTKNLIVPLPITTYFELKNDPDSAPILAAMIADGLGIGVNTYSGGPKDVVTNDKPGIVSEVLEKMAQGDEEGAKSLAHDFNTKLKESITQDIEKKNPDISPEDLDKKVNTAWKKDAIYLPTPADVESYKAGDVQIVEKVTNNGKPVIVKDTAIPSQGLLGTVVTYARAIGTDPVTAFNDIFKGQRIRQVTNGTVIVERMSLKDSQAVKSTRGGNNPTMKLDHTLPLELGGNNEESNLKLVPTSVWASYTPVEDYLGKKLKGSKISKDEAQESIKAFKNGTLTFAEIKAKFDKR